MIIKCPNCGKEQPALNPYCIKCRSTWVILNNTSMYSNTVGETRYERISLTIPEDLLKKIHDKRGDVPLSRFVAKKLEEVFA